jgi:pyruvate,orthophosphate dikinase
LRDLDRNASFGRAAVESLRHWLTELPDDPVEQMYGASVFTSWNNDRDIVYRRQNGYLHDWGTAASICSMVFDNMGDDSGTGVDFTRDPATGS